MFAPSFTTLRSHPRENRVVVLIVLAAALAMGLVWRLAATHAHPGRRAARDLGFLSRADVADIEARLAAVELDEAHRRNRRLVPRLQLLVDRRVPARCVEPAPGIGVARVRFADGTTVFARGAVPGDVALLAVAVQRRSLPPTACSVDSDGTHLIFGGPPGEWGGRRRRLSILVTGLDQPE
jgi:hypothetical protein